MHRDNLLEVFAGFADLPDEFLLYDDGFRTSRHAYRDVAAAARLFTVRLRDAGLRKGDKVLLWGENRPEWIVAMWGCVLGGIVVVPIDYRSSGELLMRVQHVAGARLLVRGDETEAVPELGIPVWPLQSIEWRAPHEPFVAEAVSRDDLAEVLFTSGATADPKGVLIRHGNILANIDPVETEFRKYKRYAKPFRPIRFLNLLPLSHMFGQAMSTFIPPMLPGIVVFMRGFNPNEIVRQIHSRRISVLVCVPKILDVLKEYILSAMPEAAEPPKPGSHWMARWWRYRRVHRMLGWKFWAFIVGAAPLDPELEEFWTRMGYVVIQGYGLTETAPIVSLNHPLHTKKGAVGKPIPGVEVKISDEGEILVRGEVVTSGYLNADPESESAFQDGWFHTGDVGSLDESGQLYVRGRKKEMIVTPEGLNVFPEDIEKVLNTLPGVRDSAAVGVELGGQERVHAVLLLEPGTDASDVVRLANIRLEDHQKIRGFHEWTGDALPRTEGTRKLKRREIQRWVVGGGAVAPVPAAAQGGVDSVLAAYVPGRKIEEETTIDELGLSSLERVELLLALERRFGVTIDEPAYAQASTVADLQRLVSQPEMPLPGVPRTEEPWEFPTWNRTRLARWHRRVHLPLWVLPLARVFVWVKAEGLENLRGLEPPVIFAPNHQSHLDVPAILAALPPKWRYRVAPAMSKEFFKAHFYPKQYSRWDRFTNSLNYYLGSLMFNAFPLPQREIGARQTLRYAGELASEGWCIMIFPEGKITLDGNLNPFQPGVGMLASKLAVPVVPIRISGLDRILPKGAKFPTPGRVSVRFGAPLTLQGEHYPELAKQVEDAVRKL